MAQLALLALSVPLAQMAQLAHKVPLALRALQSRLWAPLPMPHHCQQVLVQAIRVKGISPMTTDISMSGQVALGRT
jgi:hypothetical protein